MRLPASLLSALALFGFVAAGYAQSSPSFEQVEVELWPEYDRQQMLVIYRAELPPTVELPARVGMPIPASVGEPHAVAVVEPATGLVSVPYERTLESEVAVIWVEAESRSLWLEYYDELVFAGANRSFTFEWPAGYGVGSLLYQVQQPPQSSNLVVEPTPLNVFVGQDGLTYHSGAFGADPAARRALSLSYSRDGDGLTIDAIEVDRGEPGQASAPGQWLAPAAGVVGGLSLVAVVAWLVARLRRRPTARRSRRRRKSPSALFCHRCGTRAEPDDSYCRQCGAELRRP